MREDHYVMYRHSSGVWYYYVYRWGKRVFRSTGEKRKSEALCVIHDRMMHGDLLNEGKRIRPKTFAEYSEPFFVWERCPIIQDKVERGGHYSKEFAYSNRKLLEKYILPVFKTKVLPEITPAMVNTWLRGLPIKYRISPQTANKVLTILRQILDFAISENLLEDNPARKVKPLIPQETERGCFTKQQIRTLFSSPWRDRFVELACRLSAFTGMRLGEIRGLRKSRIHEDCIEIDRSWSDREGLKSTKSGKPRVVPISPGLAHELLSVPNNGEFVFSYRDDIPIHGDTIRQKLDEQMESCGIDHKSLGLTFHSFRHYFNTQLVAAGVDENNILAVVGHSDRKMTQHYLHLSSGDMDTIRKVQEGLA